MRLLTFERQGRVSLGVATDKGVVDLSIAAPDLPETWPEVFGALLLSRIEAAVESAADSAHLAEDNITFLPPIPLPPKIVATGLNYHAHAAELDMDPPPCPVIFSRYPTSLVGHGQDLVRPRLSDRFDYEGELVFVIGKGGRYIAKENALDHVVGYSVCNEGSVRDYQFKTSQWGNGKTFDRSGAFGPYIVTVDEVPSGAAGLNLWTRLNGDVVQEGNTDDMIFSVAELVVHLSSIMTLEPGDIVFTGTPPGVGQERTPPLWMKPGDRCDVEIESIGLLRNPVVAEEG